MDDKPAPPAAPEAVAEPRPLQLSPECLSLAPHSRFAIVANDELLARHEVREFLREPRRVDHIVAHESGPDAPRAEVLKPPAGRVDPLDAHELEGGRREGAGGGGGRDRIPAPSLHRPRHQVRPLQAALGSQAAVPEPTLDFLYAPPVEEAVLSSGAFRSMAAIPLRRRRRLGTRACPLGRGRPRPGSLRSPLLLLLRR